MRLAAMDDDGLDDEGAGRAFARQKNLSSSIKARARSIPGRDDRTEVVHLSCSSERIMRFGLCNRSDAQYSRLEAVCCNSQCGVSAPAPPNSPVAARVTAPGDDSQAAGIGSTASTRRPSMRQPIEAAHRPRHPITTEYRATAWSADETAVVMTPKMFARTRTSRAADDQDR